MSTQRTIQNRQKRDEFAERLADVESPFAPGRPFHFLFPVLKRLLKKWDMPPVYADPELAQSDRNYPWASTCAGASLLEFGQVVRRRLPEVSVPALIMHSCADTTVAPESAEIVYRGISTPDDQKRIVWFERTEHEMFCDCEREAAIETVAGYVRERNGGRGPSGVPDAGGF